MSTGEQADENDRLVLARRGSSYQRPADLQAQLGFARQNSNGVMIQSSPPDNPAAPHACPDCNAQFTRLEHLKRHVSSLHRSQSPKPHGCQFCGKTFSRRDVLLRHHQSCRSATGGNMSTEPKQKRVKRACKNCTDHSLKCTGGTTCAKCMELGAECVYSPSRPKNARSESYTATMPSAMLSGAHDVQQTTPGGTNLLPSPPVFSATFENEHAITLEQALHQSSAYFSGQLEDLVNNASQHDGTAFDLAAHGDSSLQRTPWQVHFPNDAVAQVIGDQSVPDAPQRANSLPDAQTSKSRKPTNKRGRYVLNACMNCQKRKVKCSGEETCLQCHSADLVCIYVHGRKRRNTTTSREEGPVRAPRQKNPEPRPPPVQASTEDPKNISQSLMQIMARIASLERDSKRIKNHVAIAGENDGEGDRGSGSSETDDDDDDDGAIPTPMPSNEVFHGATSLLELIDALNRTVASEEEVQPDPSPASMNQSDASSITWHKLPRNAEKDVKTLAKETRACDIASMRRCVDVFFEHLNPQNPCVNENQFRSQLERFLGTDAQPGEDPDPQFLAMVNLVQAEVKILGRDCKNSSTVPGWEEFCRAENILSRLLWLGCGNLRTIQCLLIKARYLLYIEMADSAYDTMGRCVRLCFQLGLHDQRWWTGCSEFDRVMRQRIFWGVVFLEQDIAFVCGAPYLMRDSDFKVDMPRNYDDKLLFPNEPLPEEKPEHSFSPYLGTAAKWCKLCSEIWDTIFGINAQKETCQEFVVSMDARILYTISQLPTHLQWQNNTHRYNGVIEVPYYVLRQTLVLHLRMNHLRMILRQQRLLTFSYTDTIAIDCVSIATSTITAISTHLAAAIFHPTDRFVCILHLVGVLLPLVCVIVKSDNLQQTRSDAIDAFTRGLSIMEDMSPNFSVARHTLARLRKIIATAKQAIAKFHAAEVFTLDQHDFGAGTFVPRMTDFFNHNHWMDPDADGFGQDLGLDGPLGFSMPHDTDGSMGGTADDLSAAWMEEDVMNGRRMLFTNA